MSAPDRAAAVCYWDERDRVEVLLVRTNRYPAWTFPKGRPDPEDQNLRATAMREACEEAGVHGDADPRPLGTYRYPKARGDGERVIEAYLLRVLTRRQPGGEERMRDPVRVGVDEARSMLAEGREPRYAAEHGRILDLAVQRIGERRAADEA